MEEEKEEAGNRRPRVSAGTPPKLSQRDAARFRVLIEPPERRRSTWVEAATIGDVLDSPAPERCEQRSRWYSPEREEGGIIPRACKSRTCPLCVLPWLESSAGRAWVAWEGGPVIIEDFESIRAWKWARESRGIRVQGPSAAVGILDLPHGDGRRVFLPDPEGIRGRELDAALVAAIRAISIPPLKIGESSGPSPTFGLIPKWLSTAEAVALAREVGLTVTAAGKFVRYRGSLEATERWIQRMKNASRG